MCGLYGFIGRPTKKTREAIRLLSVLSQTRGIEGTGIAVINSGSFWLDKSKDDAEKFHKRSTILSKIPHGKQTDTVILGHTRAATMGAVTDKNSHPFRVGTKLITHNGCLNNTDEIKIEYKVSYEVDSQYIAYLLSIKEAKDVFEKSISGWWAVPYIDLTNPLELIVARHSSPFYYTHTPHGLYYASEEGILKNGLSLMNIACNSPRQVKDNSISTFKIHKNGSDFYVGRETKKHKAPYSYYDYSYNYGYLDYGDGFYSSKKRKKRGKGSNYKHKSYIDTVLD